MLFNLIKIRNYMMNEDYKRNVINYMLEMATQAINRPGNFQDGMLYMIDMIKQVPEKVENGGK